MLLISCDSFEPHQPNPYFESLLKVKDTDTMGYLTGQDILIFSKNDKGKLEGYARGFFGDSSSTQDFYFKSGSLCYRPDILTDFKEIEYSINTDSNEVLTVGQKYELKLKHDDLFPVYLEYEVINGKYEVIYSPTWSLYITPTGGDCHVIVSYKLWNLGEFPFLNHVFKTQSK